MCNWNLVQWLKTVKIHFTSGWNAQLFINTAVLVIKVAGEMGISMYIHDSLNSKYQRDLDINTKKCRVSVNRINIKKFKKHYLWTIYRPLGGDFKKFNAFLKDIYIYIFYFFGSPINFYMPPGTLTLTFLTTTWKNEEICEFNVWIWFSSSH